jgi:hypothetical protein
MKSVTILLGALLSAAPLVAQAPDANQAPATAQPQLANPQPSPKDPAKQAKHLGKQLGLSSDQVAQITPILADNQQQMLNLRTDANLSPKARRARAKAIQQGSKAKVEALLNDTQKQQYEQILAEHRNHRNRHQRS